jgi:hypothetical protein
MTQLYTLIILVRNLLELHAIGRYFVVQFIFQN